MDVGVQEQEISLCLLQTKKDNVFISLLEDTLDLTKKKKAESMLNPTFVFVKFAVSLFCCNTIGKWCGIAK